MSWFKKLFSPKERRKSKYRKEREALQKSSAAKRRKIAADGKAHPEILYYLATDPDQEVRYAIAKNKSTPMHVSEVLAQDESEDVRLALGDRLMTLLPKLSKDEHQQLYIFASQALGILAQDEVIKIRRVLSETLKNHAYAPPAVVGQLARDVEREISEPILRYCMRVSDKDLIDILAHHPEKWVSTAIAERKNLSAEVGAEVIAKKEAESGKALLGNKTAKMTDEMMYQMITYAREVPQWHEKLVLRQGLSFDMAREIAGFASQSVLQLLMRRKDFDPDTKQEVVALVDRRMRFAIQNNPNESNKDKVTRFKQAGALRVEVVQDALTWGEYDFVELAIADIAGVTGEIIQQVFKTHAPKPIVSLAWYCRFPARFSVELQKHMGKVAAAEIIYPKDGLDYSLTKDEMIWQLTFFDIAADEKPRKKAKRT